MKYFVSTNINPDGYTNIGIIGEGETEAEAMEKCFAQIRQHVWIGVEIAEGVVVPKDLVPQIPEALPCLGLLILELERSSGITYGWNFFSIPYGTYRLGRTNIIVAENKPAKYSYSPSDAPSDCDSIVPVLREHGKQFVDGVWVKYDAEYM